MLFFQIPLEPVASPDIAAAGLAAWCGRNALTVADMNRLEQAARISMGEFEDSEASVPPVPHASLRLLALGLAAVVLAAVLFQLAF
ncbi:hypothetical protein [Mesorhizobium sp. M1406]|uniref:hypothetical protein n=1 Tax=Mesorhizobium sp. M1406 TaxID=2957099 RepID=UPI003337099C